MDQPSQWVDPWHQLEAEARAAQRRGDGLRAADKWLELAAEAHRNGYYSDARVYAARGGDFDYEGPPPEERDCDTCGDSECRGHCACGMALELRGDALVCPEDRCERSVLLRQARTLYRTVRQEGDADQVLIWRRARWSALADLYRADGNERGVIRCVEAINRCVAAAAACELRGLLQGAGLGRPTPQQRLILVSGDTSRGEGT